MANRPCKPDADMKRLWQTLLPGTPMPACGTGKDQSETEKSDAPLPRAPDEVKSSRAKLPRG
jgi:hypothetical protein